MIFVQNFTLPDLQAKNFTPQKSVTCDISYRDLTAEMHQILIIWSFFGHK